MHRLDRRGAAIAAAWIVVVLGPAAACAQGTGVDIHSILADMAVQQHNFHPDKLHASGLAGLSALLDELLPDTAAPRKLEDSAETVAQLIAQMGSQNLRVRETATEKLFQLGPGAKPYVVEAVRHADAEVSCRATRILRGWEARKWEDKSKYVPAFTTYLTNIRDDERLKELVRRTLLAFQSGVPENSRYAVLNLAMRVLASAGKDEYTDPLRPLLKQADVQVAVLVTQSVGEATTAGGESKHYPGLLLEALQSEREEVVNTAIPWAEHSIGGPRRAEVERLLVGIFRGQNEQLKFQVCGPLMNAFKYAAAREYLLEQAQQQADLNRRYMALSGLCSSRQPGGAPDEKLLKTLQKLLADKDQHTRYMAANALSSYSGEAVVTSLIPLLADTYHIIPHELNRRLLDQPDKAMLRRVLGAAAKDTAQKDRVRQQVTALLEQLDRNERAR